MAFGGIKFRWIILALILLPVLPQLPSCVMANAAKYGRVVDATTGKGIPGAAVIHSTRLYTGSAFFGGNPLTRVVTYTDKNGNYWIPSAWLSIPADIPFRFPGANTHTGFLIATFKPGYASVGDDDAWNGFDEFGWPHFLPKSAVIPPRVIPLGPIAKVDTLEMKPVQLTVKQAASYYRHIFNTGQGGGPNVGNKMDDAILSKLAYDLLLPQVCEETPNTKIDAVATGMLGTFVKDHARFMISLKASEPFGFQDREKLPVLKDYRERYEFSAQSVCLAMKAGGE